MRYGQKWEESGLIINMTTALQSSCLFGNHPGSFQVAGPDWRDVVRGKYPRIGKTEA